MAHEIEAELAGLIVQTVRAALGPILARVAAVEAATSELGALRARVGALQETAGPPILREIEGRLGALQASIGPLQAAGEALDLRLMAKLAEAAGASAVELAGLRERIAVLETRAPIPGPPGRDGTDGLGFDDLRVEHDGERELALIFARGEASRRFPARFPIPIYRGVYVPGARYARGDVVSWAGSTWIAEEETDARPSEQGWTLMVKKGRDGRDAPALQPERRRA
jgi:hypothetical protein